MGLGSSVEGLDFRVLWFRVQVQLTKARPVNVSGLGFGVHGLMSTAAGIRFGR